MKIAIGNDHAGVEMKNFVTAVLEKMGHEVINFGTDTSDSVHYPMIAEKVAKAVVGGEAEKGVLICGTGIGISIAANKIKGVRCALCSEPLSAELSRDHNNANIVAMGARVIGLEQAGAIVKTFMSTEFSHGERHMQRVGMISELENNQTIK